MSFQRQDSFNDGGASQWELAMYRQGIPLAEHQSQFGVAPPAFSEAAMSYANGKDASWLRLGPPVPNGVFHERGDQGFGSHLSEIVDSTGVRRLLLQIRRQLAVILLTSLSVPSNQPPVTTAQASTGSCESKRCKPGVCHVCGPKDAAEWRRGPSGPATLCQWSPVPSRVGAHSTSDGCTSLPRIGNSCGLYAARIPFKKAQNLDEVLEQIKRVGMLRYRAEAFDLLDGTRQLAERTWPGPRYHTELALSDESLEKQILQTTKEKVKAAKGGQRAPRMPRKARQKAKVPTSQATLHSHLASTLPAIIQCPSPAGLSPVSIGAMEAVQALNALEAAKGAESAEPVETSVAMSAPSLATLNARLASFGLAPLAELPVLPDRPLEAADYEPSGWADAQAAPLKPTKGQKSSTAQALQARPSCFGERAVSAPTAPAHVHQPTQPSQRSHLTQHIQPTHPAQPTQLHQHTQPAQPIQLTYADTAWHGAYAGQPTSDRVYGGGAIPTYTLPSPRKHRVAPAGRQHASHAPPGLMNLPQPSAASSVYVGSELHGVNGQQFMDRSSVPHPGPQNIDRGQHYIQYYY